jgi:tetratricopeptide (TPR) repeat protein
MASLGEMHNKHAKRNQAWRRLRHQALLVPEAGVLLSLLLVGWALHFPVLIGLLALVTMLLFGLRLGLMALAERQIAHGDYARADWLINVALRLNPWSADALLLRAQGLSHQGEDEEAEKLLRRAAQLYPDDSALQSALAAALLAQGRIAEGWQVARQEGIAEMRLPQMAQQRAWLALHVENEPAKARAIIIDAQPDRLPPRVALPLLATLGEAQIVLGSRDEAQRTLQTIEQKLPLCPQTQQAELLYHLGRMHDALGHESSSYFRRSVELDPDGRYAQAAWRSAVNPAA